MTYSAVKVVLAMMAVYTSFPAQTVLRQSKLHVCKLVSQPTPELSPAHQSQRQSPRMESSHVRQHSHALSSTTYSVLKDHVPALRTILVAGVIVWLGSGTSSTIRVASTAVLFTHYICRGPRRIKLFSACRIQSCLLLVLRMTFLPKKDLVGVHPPRGRICKYSSSGIFLIDSRSLNNIMKRLWRVLVSEYS